MMESGRSTVLFATVLCFLIAAALPAAAARPAVPGQEASVEELLARGESLYERGEYAQAVTAYAEAAARAKTPQDLSRAWFGQAVARFYLGDMTGAREAVRNVLIVDPGRAVSTLFYPESFVRLFEEARRVSAGGGAAAARGEAAAGTPAQAAGPPATTAAVRADSPRRRSLRPPSPEDWRDKWEIEAHASSWTADPILSLLESALNDKFGDEIRDEITREVGEGRGTLVVSAHEQTLAVDSGGGNIGVGVRFYPGGRGGAFSVGLSLERTTIRLELDGTVRQDYADGSFADVTAAGRLETSPWTTHVSFRWDMVRGRRFTPYFVLGLGLASLDGDIGYSYTGTYDYLGVKESISGEYDRTIHESEEDMDINLPNIFVVLQTTLGLKLEIARGFALRAEAGVWNGLLLRGGLAYRF